MSDNAMTEATTHSMLEQTQMVASWVDGADPTAPVPSCPEWKLADLVEHIGATQQWVAAMIEQRISDPMAAFGVGWEKAPGPDQWADWLQRGAERAAAAFEGDSVGAEVFDPSGSGDGITFWRRRTFGEISVHRIDAALTLHRPYELDTTLAGLAVDDWLETIASPGWAANVPGFTEAMRGDGQTIAWVADDLDRAWVLRRGGEPVTLTTTDAAGVTHPDVAINGSAVDLLRVVSRRQPLEGDHRCRITGDRTELVHLIDNMNWVGA